MTIRLDDLLQSEKLILDNHYKKANPFLTDEFESKILKKFNKWYANNPHNSKINGVDRIPIDIVHTLIFNPNDLLSYSYDLFIEDLETFELECEGYMSFNEAIKFIQSVQ